MYSDHAFVILFLCENTARKKSEAFKNNVKNR